MATRLVTVTDILAGHVTLDLKCLDRITVQVPGQVVQFLAKRGFPIPSPAVVEKMGQSVPGRGAYLRRDPGGRFTKNDRKIDRGDAAVCEPAGSDRPSCARSHGSQRTAGTLPVRQALRTMGHAITGYLSEPRMSA